MHEVYYESGICVEQANEKGMLLGQARLGRRCRSSALHEPSSFHSTAPRGDPYYQKRRQG